jgi:Domain of unknown function (DUF4389)
MLKPVSFAAQGVIAVSFEPSPESPAPDAPNPAAPPPAPPAPAAPPAAAAPPAPAAAPISGGYPVQLKVTDARELSRLWGIPYFGMLVRFIFAIPHFLILIILGLGMYLVMGLGWIPILLLGRPIGIQSAWIKETIHRSLRVAAYCYFLFPGGYPGLEPGSPNPLELTIDLQGRSMHRLWGVPFLGIMVRSLVTIPHFIVLGILYLVGFIGLIVLWIPILIMGRYPGWAIALYGGLLRYAARVEAYLLLLPVPYPPFSLG